MDYYHKLAALAPSYGGQTFRDCYESTDDRGMYDAVRAFALGRGFTFVDESPLDDPTAVATIWGWSIHIKPQDNRLELVDTLLHELAHSYIWHGVPRKIDSSTHEQVAQLVACRVLGDYGFDVEAPTAAYLWYFRAGPNVLTEDAAEVADVVYESFRQDLYAFFTTI